MSWTRRDLLRAGATTAATALLAPGSLLRPRAARAAGAEPVLVLLFLRGGADWLNLVPPVGDARYYALRPDLAVPRGDALALDGFFGLHPALHPLLQHFQAGRLAVVDAVGLPTKTRSHFDAQDFVESGLPGATTAATGWLGRYAAQASLGDSWAAVTLGKRPARSLAGATASLAFPSIDSLKLEGTHAALRVSALERIAAATGGEWGFAAVNAFEALDAIGQVDVRPRVSFPADDLGDALRDLSLLIRARIGVRVAAVDMAGWDHHYDEERELPPSAAALAEGLDAFVADLGAELSRTLVIVVSEFGRTAFQNGSGGTDHGLGGAMLVLGGGVRGGRVLLRNGQWPGLAANQLVEQRDLAVTTDYRDVFAEALGRHMGASGLGAIFPGHTVRFPGLLG